MRKKDTFGRNLWIAVGVYMAVVLLIIISASLAFSTEQSNIPPRTQILINAGQAAGAKSITEGTYNQTIFVEAYMHAHRQARAGRQSHDGHDARVARLHVLYPDLRFREICSQSWAGQNYYEAAYDAFNVSWPSAKGHWEVANSPCRYYGISMARGRNGIIYVCMIVAPPKK